MRANSARKLPRGTEGAATTDLYLNVVFSIMRRNIICQHDIFSDLELHDLERSVWNGGENRYERMFTHIKKILDFNSLFKSNSLGLSENLQEFLQGSC